jgi:hypothetical protein
MYLGPPNIKTRQLQEFIVAIKPLPPDAYALALETEAKRVGLTKCALAEEWRQSAAAQAGSAGSAR